MAFFKITPLLLLAGMLFAACSDPETPIFPTPQKEDHDARQTLVLHQGNQSAKLPGGYTLFNERTETAISDAFLAANGIFLGDSPQAAVQHGSKIYVACYGSNLVQVIDARSQRLLASVATNAPEGIAAQGAHVYVTNNDGFLSRIDTLTLSVSGYIPVGPNPSGVVTTNRSIYVAVSDGYNYKEGYRNGFRVVRVDERTFTLEGEIRVGMNPTHLYKDASGALFVACQGDYGATPAQIWKIDTEGNATPFAEANFAAIDERTIYLVRTVTDWNSGKTTVNYEARDTQTGEKKPHLLNLSEPPLDPTTLAVHPESHNVYIASRGTLDAKTRFTDPGSVSVYSPDGVFLGRFAVGTEPCGLLFLH